MIKVLHHVSIMDRGGQETFIMNVFRNIDRTQIQFDFLCSINKIGAYDDEIKSLGGKIFYTDIKVKGNKITKCLYDLRDKIQILKPYAENYDIVHLHNYHAFSAYLGVLAFKKAGFKNIILHSHNSSAPRIKLHKIFKPLLNCDKTIVRYACSDIAGQWLHGANKFDVIYNGIDVEKFSYNASLRQQKRENLGVENKFVVGHVGRFNYQKNHLFLLDIFKTIVAKEPNSVLLLVGKGELENEITAKIKALDLSDKVILLGDRDDVNELMCAFDVLLFPSLFEGLGIVLVEAQYAKLPCVVSDSITQQVCVSNLITKLSLNTGTNEWAETCLNTRKIDRETVEIIDDKFDIRKVVNDLTTRYTQITKNNQ